MTVDNLNSTEMGCQTFYCSCGQDFDERKILEIHQQKCPTFQEFEEIDVKENNPPNQFNHHYYVHSKRLHECVTCGRTFKTKQSADKHCKRSFKKTIPQKTESSPPEVSKSVVEDAENIIIDLNPDDYCMEGETPELNTNGRYLWDFLQQLLNDSHQRYTPYISWKNKETGVFKIVNPDGIAKMWGTETNNLSMNYDKMSRALRYYYKVNILRKVQGNHCYQ